MSDPAASLERAHPLHDSPPLALSIAITPLALIGMFGTPALAVYTGAGYDLKPYPWIMAMQIGLPWVGVALAWCCPRWFSIFHGRGRYARRSSDTCSLQFEFFFPTVFVYLIHYRFAVLPARQGLLPWACLFGAILLVGGGLRDPYLWGGGARMHKGTLLFAALLSLFYGYAAALQIDIVLDRSAAAVTPVTVMEKFHTKGHWGVQLRPGVFQGAAARPCVPAGFYRLLQPGDTVCMVGKPGALGVAWYTAQACPWRGGRIYLDNGASL